MRCLFLLLILSSTSSFPDKLELRNAQERISLSQKESERRAKLFSIFQIVRFDNEQCTTTDPDGTQNMFGTCYSAADCANNGGTSGSTCAEGYGVCCLVFKNPCDCDQIIRSDNAFLTSPGFPVPASDGNFQCAGGLTTPCSTKRRKRESENEDDTDEDDTDDGARDAEGRNTATTSHEYVYKVAKLSTTTSQIRFNFETLELSNPTGGACTNDSISITGLPTKAAKSVPGNLCGFLSGQHFLVDVSDMSFDDAITISVKLSGSSFQRWSIRVDHIDATETASLAPAGCLQFYTGTKGTLGSFNNVANPSAGGMGELLTNHVYSACLQPVDGYCDVSLVASMFDMGSAKIAFGTSCYTGSTFGTDSVDSWTYSGPYTIPIVTGGDNSAMSTGFNITYTLLPCS